MTTSLLSPFCSVNSRSDFSCVIAVRYSVDTQHTVDDHVLKSVHRFFKLVAHATSRVGPGGDSLLHGLNDLDVLPVDHVPKLKNVVELFVAFRFRTSVWMNKQIHVLHRYSGAGWLK